jgi:hypothetical protein
MTQKQEELIMHFTHQSLTECLVKIDQKFQALKHEISDDLIQGIRLDVWDRFGNPTTKADKICEKNKFAFSYQWEK